MLDAIAEAMTTTAMSTPFVEDGRQLLKETYSNILNWIDSESHEISDGMLLQINQLQLSEEEIIAYLASEAPPWKVSETIFGANESLAEWISVGEIRINGKNLNFRL